MNEHEQRVCRELLYEWRHVIAHIRERKADGAKYDFIDGCSLWSVSDTRKNTDNQARITANMILKLSESLEQLNG